MHSIWFRRDLRLLDNLALSAACRAAKQSGQTLIAAYIATPEQWRAHHMAPIQADFIHRRLVWLQQQLAELGIELLYTECADFNAAIQQMLCWIEQRNITDIYINRQYEVNEQQRDQALIKSNRHVAVHCFDDAVLIPPGQIRNGNGQPYKVFSAFKRKWLEQLHHYCSSPLQKPAALADPLTAPLPVIAGFSYPVEDSQAWPIDDDAFLKRLSDFCQHSATPYQQQRDIPSLDGTSQLSPYLANGLLSPRQCLARLIHHHPEVLTDTSSEAFSWLNELIWREFYIHLINDHPRLVKGAAFQRWTERIHWSDQQQHFEAWKKGRTGYPIVDAAMRQLNSTGWMHNRLRMITASFLCKDLLISWRDGEQYFMSKLIDGDFAANNGGWQWCASTGTDAQPYFRIFNPTTQGKRFDPDGVFIRRWLPELNAVPDKFIHEPWRWANKQGLELAYPKPIVDHQQARQAALDLFSGCKQFHEDNKEAHEHADSAVY
jgi:deoxyribodipyrimidine photo-lyase